MTYHTHSQKVKIASIVLAVLSYIFSAGSTLAQNVSVDPLSGTANVSIPIYNITYGSVSVPVNLNHNSSGLRVEDSEGDAGLGWNLTCNYGVYRQVRGLPDDLALNANGWLVGTGAATVNSFSPSSDDDFTSTYTDETNDFNTLTSLGYQTDTEPDLYTVVGPGLYFQFVYDATHTPRLLNYEDVKITSLGANGFTIKNNIGQTFQFVDPEMVSRQAFKYKNATINFFTSEYNFYSPRPIQFVQTWHLTSVTDAVGNVVNFNYTPLVPTTSNDYRITIGTVTNAVDTLYNTADSFTPLALNSITAGNYSVNFGWTSSKRLASIKISESGLNDTFEYGFEYQEAKSNTNTTFPHYFHYFLTKIVPTSSTLCAPQAPYQFMYQGVNPCAGCTSTVEMPWSTLYSQDMWGYYSGYTGANSTQNIPQIYYYSGLTDSRRFSFSQIPNNSPSATLAGSNRNVQASKVGIGSLVQVSYPTGGFTKIAWERNKYLDSLSGQVIFGPGLRVTSLTSEGGEAAFGRTSADSNPYHQIVKSYTYTKSDADTTTSGIVMYPPEYAFSTGNRFIRTPYNMNPGSYVSYRRVKETTSQGSSVYTYSLPAEYPLTSYSTDWTATKSKIARNPATHQTLFNVKNGSYTFPFAPNPNYGFAQGLLTSVSEFSTTNALVRKKQYFYSRLNTGLQSVYGLKFEYMGASECDCFHFSKYEVITGAANVLTKQVTTEVSETNSTQSDNVTTFYHYNNDVANSNFFMDSVRTVWGDGSVTRKKIKYVKDFASLTNPTPGDVMANAIPALITANRHGEPVEQYTSFKPIGGSETITGSSLQLFQVFNGKVYPYRSYALPEGMSFTASSIAAGATQGFSFNSKYILSTSLNDFDASGNPVSISDNKQNKVAHHFAQNYSLGPIATFANTTATQTVHDGFEFATGRNLTPSSALGYTTGWTGQRAAVLTSAINLSHTSVNNAGIPYRVSCYVKAAQNSNVTFQFINPGNSAVVASVVLPYTTLNQWIYLEGTLNVSSGTPTTLKLQVTSDATITIDDILVLPQNATASLQTYLPLKGVTSQTDDRGNSTTVTYDVLGRKVNTFDRQRNLVEFDEYQFKGAPVSVVNSFFTYANPVAGTSFTAALGAGGNCFSSAAYEWRIDGAVVGTNAPTLATTVATAGAHDVQLKVTNTVTQQSSTSSEKVEFLINSTPPTFSFTALPPNNVLCSDHTAFTYIISTPALGCNGAPISASDTYWSISNDGVTYISIPGAATSTTYNPETTDFYIKATVNQTCSLNNGMTPGTTSMSASIVQHITVSSSCEGH